MTDTENRGTSRLVNLLAAFGSIAMGSRLRLLPEMHRVLKAEGVLALWLFPTTAGVPTAIRRSGLFTVLDEKNGVYTYKRSKGPR